MAEEEFCDRDVIRETELPEFVPVVFAKNLTHAEQVKMLLEENEIPVVVEDAELVQTGIPVLTQGIPVLVPEGLLDDASALVAGRERSSTAVCGSFELSADDSDDGADDDDFDDFDDDDDDYDDVEDEEFDEDMDDEDDFFEDDDLEEEEEG